MNPNHLTQLNRRNLMLMAVAKRASKQPAGPIRVFANNVRVA